MTDAASALAFLKTLFHGVPGDIFLCSLPNTPGDKPGERSLRTRDQKAAKAFIEKWDRPGRGLFFCIGTIAPDAQKTPRGNWRAKKNIWRVPALPIDIDFDKLPDIINKQASVIGMLERSAVPPQLTVLSGGGVHAYWILEKAIEAGEFDLAERMLRKLVARFGSDPAVCDVSRLMRLPGTTNSKRGDERPVIISKNHSDGRVIFRELLELTGEPPAEWAGEGFVVPDRLATIPRGAHGVIPSNRFEAYGADAWNAPIDVGSRLAAMRYQGEGDAGVHVTQLACTASLLNSGMSFDDTVELVLNATMAIAPANWDRTQELHTIEGMCQTWFDKHPEIIKPNGQDHGATVIAFPGPASGQTAEPGPTTQAPEKPATPRLAPFLASSLAGLAVPERFFLVEPLIPCRDVTLLSGDGGSGKSLLTLQLAVAMQNRQNMLWLGLPVSGGPVLLYTAEEERDELHRRLVLVAERASINIEELTELHLVSLAGEDATLAWAGPNQQLAPTQRFKALETTIAEIEPALIVVDTIADTFGANENDRRQAGQFVRMLRGLALRYDCAVLLCSQPSRAGLNSGDGMSGSTAWNNSVRSRLYLERVLDDDKEEANVDIRTLRSMKANYAQKGFELQLQWQDGVFVPLLAPGENGLSQVAARDFAEHKFLFMLNLYTHENREVSPRPSSVYAPALFAADHRADHVSKKRFAYAMNQLLQDQKIKIVTEGPPSKPRQRLVIS